jgi:hypothetical protein
MWSPGTLRCKTAYLRERPREPRRPRPPHRNPGAKLKILNYCPGADTGGQSWRLKQAFDKHSEMGYHSYVRLVNYINYPRDLNRRELGQYMRAADVIHVNDSFAGIKNAGKPMVVHYHGTKFRNNMNARLAEKDRFGASGVVSTLDLLVDDSLEWLPAPYDIEWLETFRAPIDDGVYRVAHAPTNRAVKSTEAFLKATTRLGEEMAVEVVLIEKADWLTTLARKGVADVFFDQVILGYGNNSIEAWGMGIPVVAGAQPDTLAKMRERFDLPFYQATEDTIYEALRELVDPDTRAEWAKRGKVHAEQFHADEGVVRRLEAIYREVSA